MSISDFDLSYRTTAQYPDCALALLVNRLNTLGLALPQRGDRFRIKYLHDARRSYAGDACRAAASRRPHIGRAESDEQGRRLHRRRQATGHGFAAQAAHLLANLQLVDQLRDSEVTPPTDFRKPARRASPLARTLPSPA